MFITTLGTTAVLTACGASRQSSAQPTNLGKGGRKNITEMMEKLAKFAQQIESNTPTNPPSSDNLFVISGIFDRGELSLVPEHRSENGIQGLVFANSKPQPGFYPQAHFLNNHLVAVSAFDSKTGVINYLPISNFSGLIYFTARGFGLSGEKLGNKTSPILLKQGLNTLQNFQAIRAKFFYGDEKEVNAATLD